MNFIAKLIVMNEILHANIFFFIASVATVIFCILVCVILYQVIKILESIRAIVRRIELGSEQIASDVMHVRGLIANGGMLSRIISFIMGATFPRKRSKQRDSSEN